MSDIKQALRDFVATSNSGKYSTEDEILSKFPELQGYDKQLLRDFVATSNSGKYSNEDEVFSKFPEFNADVKKKTNSDSTWRVAQDQPNLPVAQKLPNLSLKSLVNSLLLKLKRKRIK